MKRRIVIAVSSIILILVAGVFFACRIVNDKDEEEAATVTLRPTVDIDKTTKAISIGVPVQPDMKYVTFYRLADGEKEPTIIGQCIVNTSILESEGCEVIQMFDSYTDSAKTYTYYARYEGGASEPTAKSYKIKDVGGGEVALELPDGEEKPVLYFYSNASAKIAQISMNTNLDVPTDFFDDETKTTQLCLALKVVGEDVTKLFCFAEMPDSNSFVCEDYKDKDVKAILPSYMQGKSILLRGVLAMKTDVKKTEDGKKILYTRRNYTKLSKCTLLWKDLDAGGGLVDPKRNGTNPIDDNIFIVPKLDVKDPIDFY